MARLSAFLNSQTRSNNPIIQIISIITFNDGIQNLYKISEIINVDYNDIVKVINSVNFLSIRDENINFVSKSFRNFLSKKLKKYESTSSAILINYYTSINDVEAIINLPTLYERNDSWAEILKLLTVDNLGMIITNNKSLAEIKKQINYGYKASESLTQSFVKIFNFALYRSTINALQTSDSRESQIKASVSLGDESRAFSLISSAILKEDKLKMLIIYVKVCKKEKINIDESTIQEIRESVKTIDREYLTENVVDIASGVANFLPELAVQIVEEVSGLKSESNSLEQLMGYVGTIINKGKESNSETINIDDENNKENNTLLDKFSKSFGLGISEIKEDGIIDYLLDIDNINDKLYIVRKWIKINKKSKNIHLIIEYAFNLLLQSSSVLKPTTTILLDIISPLEYIEDQDLVYSIIEKIDELTSIINSPTNDKVKIDKLIIESLIKFDLDEVNDRYIKLDTFISKLSDYSIKLEALADCWSLIKYIEKHSDLDVFISDEKYTKENINKTLVALLTSTAEHYSEVKSTLEIIAEKDFDFAIEIASMFNTSSRRNTGILRCIDEYTILSVSDWDENKLKKAVEKIDDINVYTKAVYTIFDSANDQKDIVRNHQNKIKEFLPLINKIEIHSVKCYILIKAIALLSLQPEHFVSLKYNYSKLTSKLTGFLNDFWNKIDIPWKKIDLGYSIASKLAEYDKSTAQNYYTISEKISEGNFIDNDLHSYLFASSIRLMIRIYCGIIETDPSFKYDKIGNLINKLPSNVERTHLQAELAVRAKLANVNNITNEVVAKKIIPVIEDYKNKKDTQNYYILLEVCASAIHASQPESLRLYLEGLSASQKEDTISIVCYVLITKCYELDPYNNKVGSQKFKFQDAIEFINLIEFIEKDSLLFHNIRRLCYIAKTYPTNFTREQKTEIKKKLLAIISKKLPNTKSDVNHAGYLIASEACAQYFNLNSDNQNSFYDNVANRVEEITNTADKSLVYSILANECENKKRKIEFLNKSFEEADKIVSVREKIEYYQESLEIAKSLNRDIFNEKIRYIHDEIYKLDESEMFPTSRKLIDLAYKTEKGIAQKLIYSLDNDPGRKKFVEPANDYFQSLELEKSIQSDYVQLNRMRSRRKIANLAYDMLGELNSNKRNPRDMAQILPLVRAASMLPFFYSIPLFEFFLQNIIKSNTSIKKTLPSFYDASYANAKLCYDLISSVSNKKSNLNFINSVDKNDSFFVMPGLREEAFEFIETKMRTSDSKEIYIIDPYFSIKDMDFIKKISVWNYNSTITVLTTPKGDTDFNRLSYINAWDSLSSEEPPQVTIVRITGLDNIFISPNKSLPLLHDRWILMHDKETGLKLGTSINSIGFSISEISVMSAESETEKYNSIVVPLVNQRVKEFHNSKIKYESLDF